MVHDVLLSPVGYVGHALQQDSDAFLGVRVSPEFGGRFASLETTLPMPTYAPLIGEVCGTPPPPKSTSVPGAHTRGNEKGSSYGTLYGTGRAQTPTGK